MSAINLNYTMCKQLKLFVAIIIFPSTIVSCAIFSTETYFVDFEMSSLAATQLNDKNHGCRFIAKHLDHKYKQTNDFKQGNYSTEQYGIMYIEYDHETQITSISMSCEGDYPKAFDSIHVSVDLEPSVPFKSIEDSKMHNSSWVQEGFSFNVSKKKMDENGKQEIKFLQAGNTAANRAYKASLYGLASSRAILGLSHSAGYPLCSDDLYYYLEEVTLFIPPQEPRTYKDYLNIDFIEEYPRPDTIFIKDWELSATMRTTTC